jgi:hypothetical protein
MTAIRPGLVSGAALALTALAPVPAAAAPATGTEARPAAVAAPTGAASTTSAPALPPWLADRGRGLATSQFGTYVEDNEWLAYTFYEYTKTTAFEYAPRELGFVGSEDHFATLTENEGLLFLAHAITDRLEVEVEGALYSDATFEKAPDDFSAVPNRIKESGLGDVEGQVRWRWSEESAHRPEMFSFLEIVLPLQKDRLLIGTQDWEYTLGFAAIKGFRFGTLTGRVSLFYDGADQQLEAGEYAIEYLKRVSPNWRLLAAVEGETDEIQMILQAEARLSRRVSLKLNSGFGLTEKAPDYAPEIGLLFTF